jgi:hypothetical protein
MRARVTRLDSDNTIVFEKRLNCMSTEYMCPWP